ncbi:hypothetical protein FA13DRAFT_1769087 [Coprinellus micaceus]|uniref:Wbp11/ELF5/Saf1 N-terminal domain-containing protein n=1 Tax=Coprinellus micaceus TaxID=71717 RepID=A0A4Y7R883_COPMI|nr:hypothetical protein FA13DRAFT_1769087 [Coprinellus micaceus]
MVVEKWWRVVPCQWRSTAAEAQEAEHTGRGKAQRKKELKKNKADRSKARDFALVKKDTTELEDEIERLEKQQQSLAKAELEKINAKKLNVEETSRSPKTGLQGQKERGRAGREEKTPSRNRNMFDKKGLPRHPERSIYYDPVMNPFGRREVNSDVRDGSDDEDIPLLRALPLAPNSSRMTRISIARRPTTRHSSSRLKGPGTSPLPLVRASTRFHEHSCFLPRHPWVSTTGTLGHHLFQWASLRIQVCMEFPLPLGFPPNATTVGLPPPLPNADLPTSSPGMPLPHRVPLLLLDFHLTSPTSPSWSSLQPWTSCSTTGFFPRRSQSAGSMQDPLSKRPNPTLRFLLNPRATAALNATVEAAPELRDFKKEATAFVPAAVKRKKAGTGPVESNVDSGSRRPDLQESKPKDDYAKFVEEMGDILG